MNESEGFFVFQEAGRARQILPIKKSLVGPIPPDGGTMGLSNFLSPLTEQVSSADERFFVSERLARRFREQTDVTLKVSVAFHIFAASIMPFIALPEMVTPLIVTHVIMLLFCVAMIIENPAQDELIRKVYPFLLVVVPVAYAISASRFIARGDPDGIFISGVGIIMVCMFALLMDPGSKKLHILWTALFCGLGYWAFSGHKVGLFLGLINSVAAILSFVLTQSHKAQYVKLARLEYNLLIRAAPAKIVRQSASGNISISEAFAPRSRRCVCVSSDWRGYQALSETMSVDALSRALGDYYEMCERVLSAAFPDGNYYTDWIADEFFAVIYSKGDNDKSDLVNQSLQFAFDLVMGKKDFVTQHGLPEAIDIGVSYGDALIGMMGPAGHQKVTALGEVPGRARRIQGAGKLIRMSHGECDRVIFGSSVLLGITRPFHVQEFVLESGKKIRDTDNDRLYFLDPEAESKNITAA